MKKNQIINLVKNNPAIAQSPMFQNEAGIFDDAKFIEYIADLKVSSPDAYAQWTMQEDAIIENAKQQTYFNLIKAGLGTTAKEGEWVYRQEADKVDVSFVQLPYSSIADSTLTISDSEIKAYMSKRKDDFKQESMRNIQYVFVEEKASEGDINTVKENITKLLSSSVEFNQDTNSNDTIPGFSTVTNVEDFVNKHSDIAYDSTFVTKKQLPSLQAEDLFALEVGAVYGPYEDNGYFKISKMTAKRPNGSARASHILVAYQGAQNANPSLVRTKEAAKAKIDSLLIEVKKPEVDFATVARENSEDGAASQGGDLGFFQKGDMVKPFADYVFGNGVGSIGVVETDFGYHIVKITEKEDVVQLATIAQEIEASENTINDLFAQATKFEMAATEDYKNFGDIAKGMEMNVLRADNLLAIDEYIVGLGSQRSIVQWAFAKDTKHGNVKRFSVNNGYVIAQLTKKTEEGLAAVKDARPFVEPILIKEKKAELLKKKMEGKSMQDIASANKVEVKTATGLTMKNPLLGDAGREPRVVGTAFALEKNATSGAIEGSNGVYMIQVTNLNIAPKLDSYKTYMANATTLKVNRAGQTVYLALRKAAEVEDNRAMFY